MRAIRTLAVATAAAAAFGANAAVILVDNFSSPVIQTVVDPNPAGSVTANQSPLCGACLATSRSIMADMTVGPTGNVGIAQSVTVGSGAFPANALSFATAPGVDQSATVTWTIPPVALSGPVSFFFRVLFSDASSGENNVLSFSINGSPLATASIGSILAPTDLFIPLTAAQVASLAAGGSLSMQADGGAGWDLTVTSFSFQVPEPASLALVGLGLLGAGLASRRKSQQ